MLSSERYVALEDWVPIELGTDSALGASSTPSSHHKIFPHKTCSEGWVAQKNCLLIGSLTAALRLSKGLVRKYLNLVMGIGCRVTSVPGLTTRIDRRAGGFVGIIIIISSSIIVSK